jgi:hypothetical protein
MQLSKSDVGERAFRPPSNGNLRFPQMATDPELETQVFNSL